MQRKSVTGVRRIAGRPVFSLTLVCSLTAFVFTGPSAVADALTGAPVDTQTSAPSSSPSSPSSPSDSRHADDLDRRIRFWGDRAERDPLDPIARVQSAAALLQHARATHSSVAIATALQRLQEAEALGHITAASLGMKAMALIAQHRFNEAEQTAIEGLALDANEPTALAALGDATLERGDLKRAKTAYQQLLKMDRGLFSLFRQANLMAAQGKQSTAAALFVEAAQVGEQRDLDPVEIARCYVMAADIELQRGKFKQSGQYLDAAEQLVKNSASITEHRAEWLAAQDLPSQANELYKSITSPDTRPDILIAWADTEAELGNDEHAKVLRNRALNSFEQSVRSGGLDWLRPYSLALIEIGRADDAARWAGQDSELRPTAEAWATLGWAKFNANQHKEAIELFDRARASQGALSPSTLEHAALAYQSAGRSRDAKRALKKAIKLRGKHPEAKRLSSLL